MPVAFYYGMRLHVFRVNNKESFKREIIYISTAQHSTYRRLYTIKNEDNKFYAEPKYLQKTISFLKLLLSFSVYSFLSLYFTLYQSFSIPLSLPPHPFPSTLNLIKTVFFHIRRQDQNDSPALEKERNEKINRDKKWQTNKITNFDGIINIFMMQQNACEWQNE